MSRIVAPVVATLVAAGIVALLVFGVAQKTPNGTLDDALNKGRHPLAPQPTRVLPALDGGKGVSLASLRGHVVVLNFWASWCNTCTAETGILARAQRQLAPHGGTVLGATYDDVPSDSRRFLAKYHLSFPNVRDVDTDLAHAFGTVDLPETFVIDRSGRIVAISRGALTGTTLTRWISQALAS